MLAAMLSACKNSDIDEADKVMEMLDAYEYESGGELIEWLRAQVNMMEFEQIAERLSQK
jgi:hypothetical protein